MSVRFEVLKTTAGYYIWRIVRGDSTVYQSREFLSAKGAADTVDQIIVGMLHLAHSGQQIEIHNLTGEEI
jgi:uncharacterized protein YegP (UPF0339 family)